MGKRKMRHKDKACSRPIKVPIRQVQRMDGTPVKAKTKLPKSLVQNNPALSVIILVAIYFILDYLMMDTVQVLNPVLIVIFTLLAPSMLYSCYVYDYQRGIFPVGGTDVPRFVKNKKKYAVIGWLAVTIWGILFLIFEPIAVPKLFPILDNNYYSSQILLLIYIAPVMEEIAFRYLLYDKWLKQKCGWFFGFVIASFIFVICHPVTNVQGLIIYWVPTILFFLVYNEFGLYGSMVVHMLYNMLAL